MKLAEQALKRKMVSKVIVLTLFILSLATALPQGSKKKPINPDISEKATNHIHDEKPMTKPEPEAKAKGQKDNTGSEPAFTSPSDKLKWRLNSARKKLILAKEYLKLAEKISKKKKVGMTRSTTAQRASVRDIIRRAEKQVLHSGEKMGLSYMHYKRSIQPQ